MRRFEYVGGTSPKFWEISRSAAEVTVTFGRIGTNGQTQVKDIGTEAAAIAHVDKLVAEKVGKGYVERGGAPESAPVAAAAPVMAVAAPTTAAQKASAVATRQPVPATPPPGTVAPPPVISPARAKPHGEPREDVLLIPSGWRRSMHPRRKGDGTRLAVRQIGAVLAITTAS